MMTVLIHFNMPLESGQVQIIESIVVQKAEKKWKMWKFRVT